MLDYGDDFSGGIRISDLPFVRQSSQLPKGEDELLEDLLRKLSSVIAEELHLRSEVGIVDRVGGEKVAKRSEEVVAQEWEAGTVCQNLGGRGGGGEGFGG